MRSHRLIALAVAAAAPSVLPHQAIAQTADQHVATRTSEVVEVLRGELAPQEVFTARFLQAIPPEQLGAFAAQLIAQHGKITGADDLKPGEAGVARFLIHFERAVATGTIQLEAAPPWRIGSFQISDVRLVGDSPQKILADLGTLHGSTAIGLYRLGDGVPQAVLTARQDRQFAIGSTFKLWVLDTLAEEVARGKRKWPDVVTIGRRSLPSGEMQNWPQGASITLETLATLMISKSDNTATDTLIGVLGREAIAARVRATQHSSPERLLPLLTTLEAFSLKSVPADAAAYAAADEAGQAAILARMGPTLDPAHVSGAILSGDKPVAIAEVEWFASVQDIAAVLDSLRRRADPRALAILAVNPGINPARRDRLNYAGYKGGSEVGVLNLSHLVRNRKGEWFAVVASWNDPAAPVDEQRLIMLVERLLDYTQ